MENKIKDYFEKLDPSILGLKEVVVTSIKKLGLGEANINYLVETSEKKFVFRLHFKHNTPNKLKEEYNILKSIEVLNIAPKPFLFQIKSEVFESNFIILEFIEGRSLDKLNKEEYTKYYNKLVRKLAELHKLSRDFENKDSSFNKRIKATKKTIKLLKINLRKFCEINTILELFNLYNNIFNKRIKNYEPLLRFCHGDLCAPNILFHNKEFFLIDWETAGILDPALELSYFFYELKFTEDQKNKFLDEYFKIRKDKTLRKRMLFTDFYIAFSGYFDILVTIFNIAKNKGHEEYLKSADFDEYWNWGNYYLKLICNLRLFNKNFKNKLENELKKVYNSLIIRKI